MPLTETLQPPAPPPEQPQPAEQSLLQRYVGRRFVLKAGFAAAASLAARPHTIEAFDQHVVDAERFLASPVDILVPRESDEAVATSEATGPAVGIETNYEQNDGQTLLNLANHDSELRADITRLPVSGGKYTKAGEEFVTSAGGPKEGQEYSALFVQKDDEGNIISALAVGYNGGIYTYVEGLGNEERDPEKSSGEWVKLTKNTDGQVSPVHTTTPWAQLEEASTADMRIQEIAEGSNTLAALGYRPWPSILSSAETPNSDSVTLTPDNSAASLDELSYNKYAAFGNTYVELRHARDKARQTLELYTLLRYQYENGAENPAALVEYASSASDSRYEFTIDPSSLHPDNLTDLTFHLMNHVSMAMEGITQRWAQERTPAGRLHSGDGLNAEDFFSNSVGIVGMLEIIQNQPEIIDNLMSRLRATQHMSAEGAWHTIRSLVQDTVQNLPDNVIGQTISRFGIRQINQPETAEMPLATDPLVPVEIHESDEPVRLDLDAAGVNPNNPKIGYSLTHAPVIEPFTSKVGSVIKEKIPG